MSLAGGTLIGSAVAATPIVNTTGTNLSPAFVSNGGLAAFTVTATNGDTSTLSQFYLTETTSGTSAPSVYAAVASQGSCTQSGQLECTFGQVKPGVTVTVTVAFTTGSGSSWTPDFEFSTTGYVTGKNKSHGDAFPVDPTNLTVALTSDQDKAGSYIWNPGDFTVADSPIGRSNSQSTSVHGNTDLGIPATVQDGSVVVDCVPTLTFTCPTTFFGETSRVNVANGATFGTALEIIIQLYKPGITPSQVNGIYHSWTDSNNAFHEELVQTVCSGSPTPTTVPCFTASKLGSQNLQLVFWTYHNGNVRGW